jgi:hypothetical protein
VDNNRALCRMELGKLPVHLQMEIVFPLFIGVMVACVVSVVGRAFIRSGNRSDESLPTSVSEAIIDEAERLSAMS